MNNMKKSSARIAPAAAPADIIRLHLKGGSYSVQSSNKIDQSTVRILCQDSRERAVSRNLDVSEREAE